MTLGARYLHCCSPATSGPVATPEMHNCKADQSFGTCKAAFNEANVVVVVDVASMVAVQRKFVLSDHLAPPSIVIDGIKASGC